MNPLGLLILNKIRSHHRLGSKLGLDNEPLCLVWV